MKKYLLGVLIIIGLLVSYTGVQAKTIISEQKINALVQILRVFEVDEDKITDILRILRKDNPVPKHFPEPQVKPIINNCPKGCAVA